MPRCPTRALRRRIAECRTRANTPGVTCRGIISALTLWCKCRYLLESERVTGPVKEYWAHHKHNYTLDWSNPSNLKRRTSITRSSTASSSWPSPMQNTGSCLSTWVQEEVVGMEEPGRSAAWPGPSHTIEQDSLKTQICPTTTNPSPSTQSPTMPSLSSRG